NATAWVSHQQDHHPDMGVHYNRCVVAYSTHDAGGITLNDFIGAAKIEAQRLTFYQALIEQQRELRQSHPEWKR
ncbi:MAG: 4a-hydroxytetrahydrobiopterin dehydratase, partial [Burkholderiales bacterium]